jgi:hypothetical protein
LTAQRRASSVARTERPTTDAVGIRLKAALLSEALIAKLAIDGRDLHAIHFFGESLKEFG